MSRAISVIFENGVFKPLEKVALQEHEKIEIVIPDQPESSPTGSCTLSGIIDIAQDCTDTDLSVHHDKYLYGGVTA